MKQYIRWVSILLILAMSCMVLTGCPKKESTDSTQGVSVTENAAESETESENIETAEKESKNEEKDSETSEEEETSEVVDDAEIELEDGQASGGM